MSHSYPIGEEREDKLNQTIFGYINILANAEGVGETQKSEARFKRHLRKLAHCSSFKEGTEDYGYRTVLHEVIARFQLNNLDMCEADTSTHENDHICAYECAQKRVLLHIIQEYPQLIHCHRDRSPNYSGQTPLHMAICKGNKELVEILLNAARLDDLSRAREILSQNSTSKEDNELVEMLLKASKNERQNSVKEVLLQHDLSVETKRLERLFKDQRNEKSGRVKELLSQSATGLRFKNNVMMGQLPLSIAALTGKEEIVKLLLQQEETDVFQQNSINDNLCHSLIKYCYVFPDKENTAKRMMDVINEQKNDCCKKLLLMVNDNKETPLILAAKYGQVEIVKYIMDEAYCIPDNSSGLFDVHRYDMTDIDHQLRDYRKQEDDKKMKEYLKNSAIKAPPTELDTGAPSVFDLIFHQSYKTSLSFMRIQPIQWMIIKKWRHYRIFLYICLLFHIIIMSVLTAAAVERVKSQRTVTINQGLGAPFPAYFSIVMTIISPLYIWLGCFKIVQICRRKFQITFKPFVNPYANAMFHALFLLFALCIISDFGASWYSGYNNMLLIAAVVIGWYLLLFFLRANSFFCLFTSLIQRILLQDMTRFAPIIALQLVAFSTAMFILLHNPDNQSTENYSNWGDMLLLTFKSFLGAGDIQISDSSHPVWLAIVFVIFIIMTTILMLNALIASLTSTCTDLLGNQFTPDMHRYLQQLAIILFFEGLLPNKVSHDFATQVSKEENVDRYDRFRKRVRNMPRHLMRIDVLEDDDGIGDTTNASILHKLAKYVDHKYNGKDTEPQSPLNSLAKGTQALQRKPRAAKCPTASTVGHLDMNSTIENTAERLDLSKRLDIYYHSQDHQ